MHKSLNTKRLFLGLYLCLLPHCHPSAADTIGLQCEWMLQCYLRVHILSERRRRKKKQKNKELKKCPQDPGDHLGTSQRGHPPLRDISTLFQHVYPVMSLSPFTFLLCLPSSGVKYITGFHISPLLPPPQTGSQPGDSFCELGESCCRQERTMWEQPLSNWWNMGLDLQMGRKGRRGGRCACLKPAGITLQSASH